MLAVIAISAVSGKLRAQACHEEFPYLLDHRKYTTRPEVKTMLLYFIGIDNIIT